MPKRAPRAVRQEKFLDKSDYVIGLTEERYIYMAGKIFTLIVIFVLAGLVFAGMGVYLVLATGESGESTIQLFGQTIETSSVGVACIGIGAIAMCYTVNKGLKIISKIVDK